MSYFDFDISCGKVLKKTCSFHIDHSYLGNKIIPNYGKHFWTVIVNHLTNNFDLYVGVCTFDNYKPYKDLYHINCFTYRCSNGTKCNIEGSGHNRKYGKSFKTGDRITITYEEGSLSFIHNEEDLGIAFKNIGSDFYPIFGGYNTSIKLLTSEE
jgi:hypothetical protein